jgi:plasmid stabilization system protein ParE
LKIEWGPKAAADLMELFEYIAADNIEAANRVREQIFNQTDMLAEHFTNGSSRSSPWYARVGY